MTNCQQTWTWSYTHKAWQAACRTCKWIGPLRDDSQEARQDMILHPRKTERQTMDDVYDDGSDHECCDLCGLCIECDHKPNAECYD